MLPKLASASSWLAKLNRRRWADGVAFTCHGARIGVRVNDPAVLDSVHARLPPGWKPADSPVVDALYSLIVSAGDESARVRRCNLLYVDAVRIARTMDLPKLLDALESDLHFRVAVTARRRIFVHAGVVGWHGRAIVIPGYSMKGKTTLVGALIRAGATYYSDEFAVLDAQGRVHPYAKPLYVRGADGEERRSVAAETLGARVGTKPLPVGLVAITEYHEAARWRPRVLSPSEGVLALLSHTVVARVRPRLALETLERVASSGAIMLTGRRGDAEETTAALLRRVAAPARRMGSGERSAIALTAR